MTRPIYLAALVALVAAGVSCGGDDSSDSADTGTDTPAVEDTASGDTADSGAITVPDPTVPATTTVPDASTTSIPPTTNPVDEQASGVDADTGRPLTDLQEGDVVIPTNLPGGMALQGAAQMFENGENSDFIFNLESSPIGVRLWEWFKPVGPIASYQLEDPNHPPVEIAGITWGWDDFEGARIAQIGSFTVLAYVHGLDNSEAVRFIEGLRAISIEQFPDSIEFNVSDPYSATNDADWAGAEVVASVQRFELAALHIDDQICVGLREKATPATRVFGANCHEPTRLDDSAVLGYSSYQDETGTTRWLVIGVIDSTDATVARITAPTGESVDVTTGPVNQFFDGRFFLADVTVDDSLQIATDQIIVEDASP